MRFFSRRKEPGGRRKDQGERRNELNARKTAGRKESNAISRQ